MLAIILTPTQHEYLTYVFQEYCKAGVPPSELAVAADAWKALASPQKFDLPGVQETVAIKGPVAVQVNGDMTLPLEALVNPGLEPNNI